jgi:hypothetical protein
MKRTLVLTTLTLSLLLPLVPRAAAQSRGKVINSGPAVQAGKIPPDIRNLALSTSAPTNILAVTTGSIYNVNYLNGAMTNPKTPTLSGYSMHQFIGMAFAGGTLYALTAAGPPEQPVYRSRIFSITDSNTTLNMGASLMFSGNPFHCIGEGDLAFDKSGNKMYATCLDNGVWKLITINLGNGAVTIVGPMPVPAGPTPQYTALAFNPAGDLYALDTRNRRLLKLDKQSLSNNSSVIPLVAAAGQQLPNTSLTGGMGFNDSGGLYAAFGGELMTINTSTGVLFPIGVGPYSGLVVSGGGPIVRRN